MRRVAGSLDPFQDVDDGSDFWRLCVLARMGLVHIVWIGVCDSEAKSPGAFEAIRQNHGVALDYPIASWQADSFIGSSTAVGTGVYDGYPHAGVGLSSGQPEYVASFRQMLVDQADDHALDVVETGPCHALAAVLDSPGDGISPLTGSQLVALKVRALYLVMGRPGAMSPEYNVDADRAAAAHIADDWPTTIYLDPVSLADDLLVGAGHWGGLATTNLLRFMYDTYGVGVGGRPGWSQPVFDHWQGLDGYDLEAGTWSVDSGTGLDTWTPGAGTHFKFIQTADDAALIARWDGIITHYEAEASGMSISNYLENKIMDLVFNGSAYAGQATVYVKLHTGDPGEACTANPATETTRQAATFGASSNGHVLNDADIDWTSLAATETITHVSVWDNVSAGNALWYGALTSPQNVNSGGDLSIAAGDLDISVD